MMNNNLSKGEVLAKGLVELYQAYEAIAQSTFDLLLISRDAAQDGDMSVEESEETRLVLLDLMENATHQKLSLQSFCDADMLDYSILDAEEAQNAGVGAQNLAYIAEDEDDPYLQDEGSNFYESFGF